MISDHGTLIKHLKVQSEKKPFQRKVLLKYFLKAAISQHAFVVVHLPISLPVRTQFVSYGNLHHKKVCKYDFEWVRRSLIFTRNNTVFRAIRFNII